MIVVAALALLALATNITVTVGGLVTLEPGRNPTNAARAQCSQRASPATQGYDVRKVICCQTACRNYCVKDYVCSDICEKGCKTDTQTTPSIQVPGQTRRTLLDVILSFFTGAA